MSGRFFRLGEANRAQLTIIVDDHPVQALQGDTLLVALLAAGNHVRQSEFGDGRRAGFCLMGACQDCWVRTENGTSLRACSTVVREGMKISTRLPEATWSNLA